jgi:uncharacterized 2Fe-2S/4Fe-4S cluster protein (DUF4445 family)
MNSGFLLKISEVMIPLIWERYYMSRKPFVFLYDVDLIQPEVQDKTADADRLKNELKKKGLNNVTIPLNILRKLPEELRRNRFALRLVIGFQEANFKLLDIGKEKIYGLALDIGSTNIECSLFDLASEEKTDTIGRENPQMKFGGDVLSRVQYVMAGNSADLTDELLQGINALIGTICSKNAIRPDDIYAVIVAGNTIMTHFLLGLDVRNIPVSPYIPAVNRGLFVSSSEAGLLVNQNAVIYVLPNSGSYVGGDIISGIIYSGIYKEKDPVLFIDVGTNVEVTLGCSDWIMTGAGAAGPALEEGIASIGAKAKPGTICGVKIDRLDKKLHVEAISGEEPSGICGSGLIELISELYLSNIIDQAGKFIRMENGVLERNGERGYLLFRSEHKDLFLSEHEIQNFLLSKAAMFSFLYVFVQSLGLTFRDISKVYIAGALGCGINLENAITIGLLPDMPREKFIPLGNSSLGGAEMVLLDRGLIDEIEDLLPMITYREMNENQDLMNVLQGAMFIPHTEPDLLKG